MGLVALYGQIAYKYVMAKKTQDRKPGPPKRFPGRLELRAPLEDIDAWRRAADATPERPSLSEWARGALNRAAQDAAPRPDSEPADKRARNKRLLDEAQRRMLANEANRAVLLALSKR